MQNATEGYVYYIIEGIEKPLRILWSTGSDGLFYAFVSLTKIGMSVFSATLPEGNHNLKITQDGKITEKFCDIKLEITGVNATPDSVPTSEATDSSFQSSVIRNGSIDSEFSTSTGISKQTSNSILDDIKPISKQNGDGESSDSSRSEDEEDNK